jgi:hypothetical protein
MDDLDQLLRPGHGHDITAAAEHAAQLPDFATIQSRGVRRRRTRAATALAAAAVALVAVLGGLQSIGARQAVPSSPPSHVPSYETLRPDPPRSDIRPGTYRVLASDTSAVDYTVTFPDDWRLNWNFSRHSEPELSLTTYVVDEIFADACQGEQGAVTPVGPSSADLVTALLTQPGADVTGPAATSLGGLPATRVDLHIPSDLDLKTCSLRGQGLQIWYQKSVDAWLAVVPRTTASVYVVDVNGKRQVFVTQVGNATTPADRAELQTILESITFS